MHGVEGFRLWGVFGYRAFSRRCGSLCTEEFRILSRGTKAKGLWCLRVWGIAAGVGFSPRVYGYGGFHAACLGCSGVGDLSGPLSEPEGSTSSTW